MPIPSDEDTTRPVKTRAFISTMLLTEIAMTPVSKLVIFRIPGPTDDHFVEMVIEGEKLLLKTKEEFRITDPDDWYLTLNYQQMVFADRSPSGGSVNAESITLEDTDAEGKPINVYSLNFQILESLAVSGLRAIDEAKRMAETASHMKTVEEILDSMR